MQIKLLTHYLFVLLIAVLTFACNKKDSAFKIVFTGDVMLDRGVEDELKLHGDSLLIHSFQQLGNPDFTVVNYEGTFADGGTIQKDCYNFKASSKYAGLLKQAGVTHVSIANNHIFDYGREGYDKTISSLKENNLEPLGNTISPKIIQKNGNKCAVLSASLTTYHDSLPVSSIAILKESVLNFRSAHKNIPLVIFIHWGLEMQSEPQQWQRDLAAQLIDLGVDAIIGHHPHVTQTAEFIKDKPVFYSIGNFVADAYLPDTDIGYAVELEIQNVIRKVEIIPVRLKRYFPVQMDVKEQMQDLKNHLQYSSVAIYLQNEKWMVTPVDSVTFKENSDLWMLSGENTVTTVKRLLTKSYLFNTWQNGEDANFVKLDGEISGFRVGDINNDFKTDVLFAITKKVKFDPVLKKRLNIFTTQNDALQPLWLGTKFINDLLSFDIIKTEQGNFLKTIEITEEKEEERVYVWDNFGFALTDRDVQDEMLKR